MQPSALICQPSEHTSGEARVSHAGREEILQAAPSSKYGMSYMGWFSDVAHEVRKVTSGVRVGTYNLVHDPNEGPRFSASNSCGAEAQLF